MERNFILHWKVAKLRANKRIKTKSQREGTAPILLKSTVKAADRTPAQDQFWYCKYNAVVPQGKEQFADVHRKEKAKNKVEGH
jgi:hypothetical protein